MERKYYYPLGLCRLLHPHGYSVRALFADRGHPFCFFDDDDEERMVQLDTKRQRLASLVDSIVIERQNVATAELIAAILAYKRDWDWLAHQISIREGGVYLHHTLQNSVGFGWSGSSVFTGVQTEAVVYSTYLYQFESLMVAWLLAQAMFTEAINEAPLTSALWLPADQCGESEEQMEEGTQKVRAGALLYMKAYCVLAKARLHDYEAFAKRTAISQCTVAEASPEAMDAMMALCQAMAARLVVSSNEALYEFRNHAPELSRKGDLDGDSIRPLIATWGLCSDMLITARKCLRTSRFPGSPLERFCSTMRHLAMAKIYVLDAEYLLWKSSASVSLANDTNRQLRCLELARRAGHLAYLHGTLALLDEVDGTRVGGFLGNVIESEVYEQILPEANVIVGKVASWAVMDKPLDDEDFQRTSSDTTYIVMAHFQREIREAVFDPPLAKNVAGGFACVTVLKEAAEWLVCEENY